MQKTVQTGVIVNSQKLSTAYLYLVIRCQNLSGIKAGQFVNLEIPGHKEVYLRRPFSIHDVHRNELSLLIKIIGKGTEHLAELSVGTALSVIVPLGNGYKLVKSGKALLIGGGCGIAPLLLLAKQLKASGAVPHILLGGRSKTDIVRQKEFAKYGKVSVTTEDGSLGTTGYVTALFKSLPMSEYKMLYTCGPEAMLRGIHRYAHEHQLPLQVSLESLMGCGFGVCLCCVTPSKNDGHVCVCKDGPVFDAEQLTW